MWCLRVVAIADRPYPHACGAAGGMQGVEGAAAEAGGAAVVPAAGEDPHTPPPCLPSPISRLLISRPLCLPPPLHLSLHAAVRTLTHPHRVCHHPSVAFSSVAHCATPPPLRLLLSRRHPSLFSAGGGGGSGGPQVCRLADHQLQAGCTAVVCVLTRDKVIVANAGDSRAVLCRCVHPPLCLHQVHTGRFPFRLISACAARWS
jgi:hypothetical protein